MESELSVVGHRNNNNNPSLSVSELSSVGREITIYIKCLFESEMSAVGRINDHMIQKLYLELEERERY